MRTIDKACLIKAAEELKIGVDVTEDMVSVKNTNVKYKFDAKGNVNVSYWDDMKNANRQAKNLAQLSTYYTMMNRLTACGMKMTKSVKEVATAVRANQKLTLEFKENTEKVAVNS